MFRQISSIILTAFLAFATVSAGSLQSNSSQSEKLIGTISVDSTMKVAGILINPNGSGIAYIIKDANGTWAVNLDGKLGPKFDSIVFPSFSPDGKHFAYAAKSGDQRIMVIDGKKGPGYDRISGLTFNWNSNRSAYAAVSNNRTFLVIDGKEEGLKVDNITSFIFSPKDNHYAYIAIQADSQSVVVDGIKGPGYDRIVSMGFSPDGSHFAYLVADLFFKKEFIVLDGQKGKEYDQILVKGSLFGPEGDLQYAGISGHDVYLIESDLSP